MTDFKELIKTALMNIGEEYFKQPTIKEDKFKYGERLFCYEFYHQLRCMQVRFKNLSISGDTVKSAFQSSDIENNVIPDILIHNFGSHKNNEVIIEVKTYNSSFEKGISKDFNTLNTFTHSESIFNYKLGISLIINTDFKNYIEVNKDKAKDLKSKIENNTRIELWNIAHPEFENKKLKEQSIKIYSTHELYNILNINCH